MLAGAGLLGIIQVHQVESKVYVHEVMKIKYKVLSTLLG